LREGLSPPCQLGAFFARTLPPIEIVVNDSDVGENASLGALSGYVFSVDQVDEGPVVAIVATLELDVAKLEDVFPFKDKNLELTKKGLEDLEGKFIRLDVSIKTFTG
jgi:hypothetical protein